MKTIYVKSSAQRARELVANPDAYFESVRQEVRQSVVEREQRIVEIRRMKRRAFWRGVRAKLRRQG